ncbi:L-rhamnose mutarotase [Novosphingobium rosa]|uniref:L-rhamnose mutarotase n=1 Tax=Novosphingobium rosa TaxID=76978 RepID=UPI00083035CE|nr:L-rhamnose mutarotase [Novosphingobium rosa]
MPRQILLIDLIDEADAIARYEHWHAAGAVPSEVCADIRESGVVAMEIYRTGNRLVMVVETSEDHDPEQRISADLTIPAVEAWERRMDTVQQPLPWAERQAKWTVANRIFSLAEQP